MKRFNSGFTIVEMALVVAVIGILATIVVAGYSNMQAEARDAKRKQDVAKIAELIGLYQVKYGDFFNEGTGCGWTAADSTAGSTSGWFNYQGGSNYKKSMMNCLIEKGIAEEPIGDVSNSCGGLNCRAYMKYSCLQGGRLVTYVYANLETKPHSDTDTDGTCNGSIDTSYGMNHYAKTVR